MDKRTISTEGLLTWAYQRELVAAMDSDAGLWGAERHVDGKPQRASGGAPAFLQIGEAGTSGYIGEGGNGDSLGTARCIQALQLGAIIPSTGGGYARIQEAPADALAVHRLVHDRLPKLHRLAVVHFASRGARPEAGGLPHLVAAGYRMATGEPVYRYDRGYRGGRQPWLCDLRIEPDPKLCLAARTLYRTWREGLRQIMVQLRLRPHLLTRWQVTEDLPPDEPALPAWVGALLERPEVERAPMTAPDGARGWGQTEIHRRLAEAS